MGQTEQENVTLEYYVDDNEPEKRLSFWNRIYYRLRRKKVARKKIDIPPSLLNSSGDLASAELAGQITGNIGVNIGAALTISLLGAGLITGGWVVPLIIAAVYATSLALGHFIFNRANALSKWVRKGQREPQVVSVLYGVVGAIASIPMVAGLGLAGTGLIAASVLLPVASAILFSVIAGLIVRRIGKSYGEAQVGTKNGKGIAQRPINASAPTAIMGTTLGLIVGTFIAVLILGGPAGWGAAGVALIGALIVSGTAILGGSLGAAAGYLSTAGKLPWLWKNTANHDAKRRISNIIFGLASLVVARSFVASSGLIDMVAKVSGAAIGGTILSAALISITILACVAFCYLGYKIGNKVASHALGNHFNGGDARLISSITSVGCAVILSSAAGVASVSIFSALSAISIVGATLAAAAPYVLVPLLLVALTYVICSSIRKKAENEAIRKQLNCEKTQEPGDQDKSLQIMGQSLCSTCKKAPTCDCDPKENQHYQNPLDTTAGTTKNNEHQSSNNNDASATPH